MNSIIAYLNYSEIWSNGNLLLRVDTIYLNTYYEKAEIIDHADRFYSYDLTPMKASLRERLEHELLVALAALH